MATRIICANCGELRLNYGKGLCHDCYKASRKDKTRAIQAEYYQENKEKVLKQSNDWYASHKTEKSIYNAKYNKKNAEVISKHHSTYYKENREKICGQAAKYQSEHPRKVREHVKPLYECTKLNSWFKGSNGHHLTSTVAIYLPSYLHKKVWHNMKTGKNMNDINEIAIKYLCGDII